MMRLPIEIELPDSFFEEEVRSEFVVNAETKKLWAVELDLLAKFDAVCKEHGLQYFIDAGTLLGAVRHKGFIPWDNDIDVVMLRDDYDALVALRGAGFEYPYFFQNAYTDKDYFYGLSQLRNSETTAILPSQMGFAKFNLGIFIDIFPLDYFPESDFAFKVKSKKIEVYKRALGMYGCKKVQPHTPSGMAKRALCRWILRNGFNDAYLQLEKECREAPGSYVDKIMFRIGVTDDCMKLPASCYDEPVYLPFEGFMLPAPCDANTVLEIFYGKDYMIPKQSSSIHGQEGEMIVSTDIPYTEVL